MLFKSSSTSKTGKQSRRGPQKLKQTTLNGTPKYIISIFSQFQRLFKSSSTNKTGKQSRWGPQRGIYWHTHKITAILKENSIGVNSHPGWNLQYVVTMCNVPDISHYPYVHSDNSNWQIVGVCNGSVSTLWSLMALGGVRQLWRLASASTGNILPWRTSLRAMTDSSQSHVGLFAKPWQTPGRAMAYFSESKKKKNCKYLLDFLRWISLAVEVISHK